jgi:Nif-specific ferredoxin III
MFTNRGGKLWEPEYLVAINGETCIGCGRCFKVCGRDVMHLRGINEEGALVACGPDDDDDDEFVRKIMVVDGPENCIGCNACSRVCPKNCQTHASASTLTAA